MHGTWDFAFFDAARHLTERDDQEELLADALATGDVHAAAAAIGMVARAHGLTDIARVTGIAPQTLRRTVSATGNPTLEMLLKILPALGLRMRIEAVV